MNGTYNIKPEVNTLVHIVTQWPNIYYYTKDEEPFVKNVVHGRVLPSSRDDPPNTFRVWTTKKDVALMTLGPHIVSMVDVTTGIAIKSTEKERKPTATFEIAASKGGSYKVTVKEGVWRCGCPGFSFRKHCRHIEEASALLQAANDFASH
jgi:hypothetical protein